MAVKKNTKDDKFRMSPVRTSHTRPKERKGAKAESSKMAREREAHDLVPRVATIEDELSNEREDEGYHVLPRSGKRVTLDTKGKRAEPCHWPLELPPPQSGAIINVEKSYHLTANSLNMLEKIYEEAVGESQWICTTFTSEVDGETARGFIFHDDYSAGEHIKAIDPRHFLHARADRSLRSLDGQPSGSHPNAANITARLKRNSAFWLRQQELTQGEALFVDDARQRALDAERERAWALDVVHDAVQEWSPEVRAAFMTLSGALAVDVHASYPGTFAQAGKPSRRRYDPVRDSFYVPDVQSKARPSEGIPAASQAEPNSAPHAGRTADRKGKKRARDGSDAELERPGTSKEGRRVRARKDAASPETQGRVAQGQEEKAEEEPVGIRRSTRARKPVTRTPKLLKDAKAVVPSKQGNATALDVAKAGSSVRLRPNGTAQDASPAESSVERDRPALLSRRRVRSQAA